MSSWLKKAKKKYIEYKAKAPEREKAKRTLEMKQLRTKTAFAEQRVKLVETQAKVEVAKTRISKLKSARPNVFRGLGGSPGSKGFGLRVPAPTDMWGSAIKKAPTMKKAIKRVKKRRKAKAKYKS